jgi:hypothetical protein
MSLHAGAFPSKAGASCMHQTKTPTPSKQQHSPSPVSSNSRTAHRPSRTHHRSLTTFIFPPTLVPDSKGPKRSPVASTHASQLYYAGCRLSLARRGGVHAVGADWELGGKWGRLMALSLSLSLTCMLQPAAAGGEDVGSGEDAEYRVWGFIFLSLVSRLTLLRTLSSRCMH